MVDQFCIRHVEFVVIVNKVIDLRFDEIGNCDCE